jgi:hypothetical protein
MLIGIALPAGGAQGISYYAQSNPDIRGAPLTPMPIPAGPKTQSKVSESQHADAAG